MGVSALHNQAKFVANQTHYSLLSRDAERDLVPMAEDAGLSLTVWQPLVGGFLTGKFDRDGVSTEQDSRRARNGFDFIPFDEEKGFTVLAALRTVAARHEVSPARVAIAWLLAQRAVTSVIVGARKLEQLTDNIAASGPHPHRAGSHRTRRGQPTVDRLPNWIRSSSLRHGSRPATWPDHDADHPAQ